MQSARGRASQAQRSAGAPRQEGAWCAQNTERRGGCNALRVRERGERYQRRCENHSSIHSHL